MQTIHRNIIENNSGTNSTKIVTKGTKTTKGTSFRQKRSCCEQVIGKKDIQKHLKSRAVFSDLPSARDSLETGIAFKIV